MRCAPLDGSASGSASASSGVCAHEIHGAVLSAIAEERLPSEPGVADGRPQRVLADEHVRPARARLGCVHVERHVERREQELPRPRLPEPVHVDAPAARHGDTARIDFATHLPDPALEPHRDALAGKTLVSFCTGGIRCEKAAIWMQQVGYEHVRQLDGGILGYFEQVGGYGYRDRCFVFDERVALDPHLKPLRDEPIAAV